MTENSDLNPNESYSKLLRLEMLFFLHTEEEMEEEEDVTPIEELPKWTVRELDDVFEIEEGIEVVKSTLARRFSDPLRAYVREEVAVEFLAMPEMFPEETFED
jgi:hypothetical protein